MRALFLLASFIVTGIGLHFLLGGDPAFTFASIGLLGSGALYKGLFPNRQESGRKRIHSFRQKGDSKMNFSIMGGELPLASLRGNLLITGQIESGKTYFIQALGRDVERLLFQAGIRPLSIHYDFKGEKATLYPGKHRFIMNQFDARCYGYVPYKDYTEMRHAAALGEFFLPTKDQRANNDFFDDSGRNLITSIVKALILSKVPWTFRDLVLYTTWQYRDRLKELLSRFPETQDTLRIFERGNEDIWHTLKSVIEPLRIIAALSHDRQEFSVKDYLAGKYGMRYAVILGEDTEAEGPTRLFNRILLERFFGSILALSDSDRRWILVFLDELANMPKVRGLDRFIATARSKGAITIATIQSYFGLKGIYDEAFTDKIIAEMATKIMMGCDNPMATWCSEIIGKKVEIRPLDNHSTQTNFQGTSWTSGTNEHFHESWVVDPSEFAKLKQGEAYMISKAIDGACVYGKATDSFGGFTPEQLEGNPPFIRRPAEDQVLKDWELEDYLRLNMVPVVHVNTEQKDADTVPPPPGSKSWEKERQQKQEQRQEQKQEQRQEQKQQRRRTQAPRA